MIEEWFTLLPWVLKDWAQDKHMPIYRFKCDLDRSGQNVSEALHKLKQRDRHQLPVMSNDKLVDMLHRRDIIKWLQLQSEVKGL